MKKENIIPFNKPFMTGKELTYAAEAHAAGHLSGNGHFTKLCHQWLNQHTDCHKSLLTHSCTAALEMSAILADIQPGDEVILPSYTFVSTANAFVLRGATPVFIDIRSDTLNMDEQKIEEAITDKTRAIVPVHYAGVGCEMDAILAVAKQHQLMVIEDAAQAVTATYKGKRLGGIGDFGAYSFHETKNIVSGEGGALLVNRPQYAERAEIIWEKGTNRSQFFRGEVDKYTWVDIGSSFLPSELIATYLWAQFEDAESITTQRKQIWQQYHDNLEPLEAREVLRRPIIPEHCEHNAHMYYILLPSNKLRDSLMERLKKSGIMAVFHYIPLHSAPAGLRYGRSSGSMERTNQASEQILRLPLWIGVEKYQAMILEIIHDWAKQHHSAS